MVVIGVDSHKRTHTAVAVDGNGRSVAERTLPTTPEGHLELLRWARRWRDRRWALEDCRHLTRRLEADLLRSGERVLRVPPKLMAGARRSARQPGKSDPIDALSVARAALREPDLPAAQLEGVEQQLRLLVDYRDDLIAERTRHQARLRWFLVGLGIAEPAPRSLAKTEVLDRVDDDLRRAPVSSTGDACAEVQIGRALVVRIRELSAAIETLGRVIRSQTEELAPSLLALPGCGPLTAAKIVAETAGIRRFRSRAAFANHNGSAPIPVWSGNTVRHRLNRGGNRQLNVALHRIAITQLRLTGPGREYAAKRIAAGNTKVEAIRALRRRISDEVYRRLSADEAVRVPVDTPVSATA